MHATDVMKSQYLLNSINFRRRLLLLAGEGLAGLYQKQIQAQVILFLESD